MTLDEAKLWLREHNGMVAFEEVIGRYYVKIHAQVGLEWKFVRKEMISPSSSGDGHAEAICAAAVEEALKAGGW